jgi:hypothetical protein
MEITEEQKQYMKQYYKNNKELIKQKNKEKYNLTYGISKRQRVHNRILKMEKYIKEKIEQYNSKFNN